MPARPPPDEPDRRRAPDVVEKRRAARAFNELLLGPARVDDGRRARRRRRLLAKLEAARAGDATLKPVELLATLDELLALGEPLEKLEALSPPPAPLPLSDELVARLARLHEAYSFRPEVYRFVGLGGQALSRAGLAAPAARRPGLRTAPVHLV
jgi:hypothetical protein